MRYPPLLRGRLLRRYKRFFADVRLDDGRTVTAHCPNPGSMLDVAVPGRPVLLSEAPAGRRKLRHTWELIHLGRSWVGVNTFLPNQLVEEALRKERIPELTGYPERHREVAHGSSRIDLRLGGNGRPDCWVEVKNVTLARGGVAAFPDSVTVRGQKHLEELISLTAAGHRAALLFWVFRRDCTSCRPADEIDAAYGRLLRAAVASGVEVLAYDANVDRRGVTCRRRLRLEL